MFSFAEKEILEAVRNSQLDLLKIILKTKQEKNPIISNKDGSGGLTVLHVAAYYGKISIIKWYRDELKFSNINPEDSNNNTPFSLAIQTEKLDVVEYFTWLGYSQNATGKGPFINYVRE